MPAEVANPYVFVRHLSEGGMGTVELALREEGAFRRLYAVKRLQPHFRGDRDLQIMFLDEARIAGLIRHPNVVSVLDVGEDDRGPYLVMDFVDGIPLSTLIANRPDGARIPVQIAVRIALQAAKGLHAAHELRDHAGEPLGLVHRDVSPQNLLLGFDGGLRITDFGIAKALGRSTRTQTGVLKGKFGYMSPEQLQFLEPDRRSDLFALGVVLYELLAGRRLYRNESGQDGTRRILTEPPPDIGDERTDVPAELVELLFSLLAKDPDARPTDALEVARVLEEALADLIALEGAMAMGAYLDATYPALRERRRRELDESLHSVQERNEPLYAVADPTLTAARRRRRSLSTGVIAVLTGCVFAAAAWFAARATGPSEVPTAVGAAPEASLVGEPAAEPSTEPEPDVEAEPEEDLEPEPDPEPVSESVAVVEPSTPMRGRAGMRTRMRVRTVPMQTVRMEQTMSTFAWEDH